MSRRSTPERLYAAGRAATIARLIGDGEPPDRAEAKVAAWEARNTAPGRPDWDVVYQAVSGQSGLR